MDWLDTTTCTAEEENNCENIDEADDSNNCSKVI